MTRPTSRTLKKVITALTHTNLHSKTVSDIRHNGTSVGTGDTAWSSALSTMNSSFNILSGYSYSLDSWVQLTPSSPSLTDYNSIVDYITGLTPTDGKVDSIEFAAHLTSS